MSLDNLPVEWFETTLDQIADVAETSVAAVEAVIKKKEPAMA